MEVRAPGYGDTKAVVSWCLYDWANSAFNTLIITFVYVTYFTQTFTPTPEQGVSLWGRAIAISAILIALVSPIVGALADRSGRRRLYLVVATWLCCALTAALAFIPPGGELSILAALTLVVVANVAFEIGIVFYNAYLPELVPESRIGRISGWAWGLGYIGGLACLGVALVALVRPEVPWFGIPTGGGFNHRATTLLVAGWFFVFSLPMLLWVDSPAARRHEDTVAGIRGAFIELKRTFRNIGRYRQIVRFLAARLVYNDGLVTIFTFGGAYAAGAFGMGLDEVIIFGIGLNVSAGLGALLFGVVDDRIGGKRTILITLVALTLASLLAVVAPDRTWLWIAGLSVGLFVGPNQSASRSLMGRFVPTHSRGEFFGFFAFSGKATAFLGPLAMSTATAAFGLRAGVSTVVVFFIIGGLILLSVDETEGIAQAVLPEPDQGGESWRAVPE
jgi:UMF1 family MFS transporter